MGYISIVIDIIKFKLFLLGIYRNTRTFFAFTLRIADHDTDRGDLILKYRRYLIRLESIITFGQIDECAGKLHFRSQYCDKNNCKCSSFKKHKNFNADHVKNRCVFDHNSVSF